MQTYLGGVLRGNLLALIVFLKLKKNSYGMGGKYCYMGHRRWLGPNHSFWFDGQLLNRSQEF